ncbi:arsinothricin resistance N-acetyltransferase ArsN1 family A [Cellulomonas carbonis]|uniref:GCN5 family acetyltransferase n=1 Tax=Cellulomonas carbonis T26 TaxID=947969 RepID=A0A0A0BPK8_9CELL|nr:arsinothricin resistance N-acetyltransferase ArsN1 family A [Cellulomonas carbonis]KGM09597.1 GCN5 family acetyltransferase [Cellulomonas carbonis T26]GGC07409.1 N-acetyltransferase [Cellulomonas carbonis]
MTPPAVRDATPDDAGTVAVIVNAGIDARTATFETEHRTTGAMAERIASTSPRHAFLVAELDGVVVGWAATYPYSPRAVYDGVAEYSIYVAPDAHGRGVGSALLGALLDRARAAGLHKVTSRVFPENAASLALAARHGFEVVGTHRSHARLDGVWRDVVTVEVLLL